jgi:hypothetical protein
VNAERLARRCWCGPSAEGPVPVAERLLAIKAQDLRGARLALAEDSRHLFLGHPILTAIALIKFALAGNWGQGSGAVIVGGFLGLPGARAYGLAWVSGQNS